MELLEETPAVSVVVPLYNIEEYSGACVGSLLAQTLESFQAICIDDGSSDGSLEAARRASGGDKRFSFYAQTNQGLSAARNAGMRYARGRYLLFLDGDDMLDPRTLEVLVGRAERERLDVLFFSARSVGDKRDLANYREYYARRPDVEGVLSGPGLLETFLAQDAFYSSAAMQLLRSGFVRAENLSFYEGILHEDNLFTAQVLSTAERAGFENEPLYLRRIRSGSIMTSRKTTRHLYGNFKSGLEVERLVEARRNDFDGNLIQALLACANIYYRAAAENATKFEKGELIAFAETLDEDEGIPFRIRVIERSQDIARLTARYEDSTSFKVGSALMALPCKVKDFIRERVDS